MTKESTQLILEHFPKLAPLYERLEEQDQEQAEFMETNDTDKHENAVAFAKLMGKHETEAIRISLDALEEALEEGDHTTVVAAISSIKASGETLGQGYVGYLRARFPNSYDQQIVSTLQVAVAVGILRAEEAAE